MNNSFWKKKRVFITGHTGFKGSWLSLWLHSLGADVYGFSLAPKEANNLYHQLKLDEKINSTIADINDHKSLQQSLDRSEAEIVFHLAAQSLVLDSYSDPINTFQTNIMGTVNVLESVRHCKHIKALIVITTDKCYENKEWLWAYREIDSLGGHDPYSNSKACAELVTASYRKSFFGLSSSPAVATARAGNVIGGGDWATNRLIPDLMRALANNEIAEIRNPNSVRPWQHVLEPLHGYLKLAEKMYLSSEYSQAWNFGPEADACLEVRSIADIVVNLWGSDAKWINVSKDQEHEANLLKLDSSKAKQLLNWQPLLNLQQALQLTTNWYKNFQKNKDMSAISLEQIEFYTGLTNHDQ